MVVIIKNTGNERNRGGRLNKKIATESTYSFYIYSLILETWYNDTPHIDICYIICLESTVNKSCVVWLLFMLL